MRRPKVTSFNYLALIFCISLPVGIAGAEKKAAIPGLNLVLREDCGGGENHPHLIEGSSYKYSESEIPFDSVGTDSPDRTIAFGSRVVYAFKGLRADAEYKVRVTCLSDSGNRVQSFFADDMPLKEKVTLPEDKVLDITFDLPVHVPRDHCYNFFSRL